ncbi:MAG: hypothetical protein WBW16_09175 [Bacteroidota bacterium]
MEGPKRRTMLRLKKIYKPVVGWVRRHPGGLAAIAIVGYYCVSTYDLISKSGTTHHTFLDFVLHFDSLIWMWLVAYVFIRFQNTKRKYREEEKERLVLLRQIDESRVASRLLKDITRQLQDSINNPLTLIGITTEGIRKRFLTEPSMMRQLNQIDVSLRRIHSAIKDVSSYCTANVLDKLHREAYVPDSQSLREDGKRFETETLEAK